MYIKKKCFVALFDILGFKDLVINNKLDVVAECYESTQNNFKEMIEHINDVVQFSEKNAKKEDRVSFHFFSDTFLVHTSGVSDIDFFVLLAVCDSLFLACNENELQIRGATAVGDLIVSNSMEIGKPIIDAYECEGKQDWIGCWILKECIKKISESALKDHLNSKSIVKYPIPLKNGQVKDEYAFNWVKSVPNLVKDKKNENNFTIMEIESEIKFFKNKPKEWSKRRKYENTKKFIEFVRTPEFIKKY